MAKPSLRSNVEISCTSFGRNLGICLNQAKESQRVHALEGSRNRKIKAELADWHFTGFDEASAVIDWVAEAKELMSRCPMVREEQLDTNGNGEKFPAQMESDTNGEKVMAGEKLMAGEFSGKEFSDKRL